MGPSICVLTLALCAALSEATPEAAKFLGQAPRPEVLAKANSTNSSGKIGAVSLDPETAAKEAALPAAAPAPAPAAAKFLGQAPRPEAQAKSNGTGASGAIGAVSLDPETAAKGAASPAAAPAPSAEIGAVSVDPETEAKAAANNSAAAAGTLQASCHCCHHEEGISEPWSSCASGANRGCPSCSLYHAVSTHPRCGGSVAIVGEKVCPVAPIGGGEGITKSTAGAFNNVWGCAAGKVGYSSNMALIMNPWMARTQHHLHVKTMPLDGRGMRLRSSLEKITDCKAGSWHSAHFKCRYAKARLYGSLPPVFSEVMKLGYTGALGHLAKNPQGQPTLATVGITVLFICGGKPVVVAHGNGHGGCSIEHSIYGR